MFTPLTQLLQTHQPFDAEEQRMTSETLIFIGQNPDRCFDRSLLEGHVTGSAWITDAQQSQVLLLHHRKLDRWFQPGGHCDGQPNVAAVALREAEEETGLEGLQLSENKIFDVDIHWIPARNEEPGHWHYDIRFWVIASPEIPLKSNVESKGLEWIPLTEVARYNDSTSIMRMVQKMTI
jgi:8-oxo-dGTP pyrophosphatase MutT (NUDIX family)